MTLAAIDTEFIRSRTYYPILCLVQVKYNNEIKLFDLLSEQCNVKELINILQDEQIIKIFHSARQDLEAIYSHFNFIVKNVMDTQILAKKLNLGEQVSYSFLVEKYFNIKLEKKLQYSNWKKRPLTAEQIEYAKMDVKYLCEIYENLTNQLNEKTLNEVKLECDLMCDKKNYEFNELRFWKQRFERQYKHHPYYAKIKKFILWRENLADKLNKPREHIVPAKEFISQLNKDKIELSERFKHHEEFLNSI